MAKPARDRFAHQRPKGLDMLVDHIAIPELAPDAYLDDEASEVATDAPEERAWLPSYQAALTTV
ncbi:hypothetical protein [Streptomyces sp. NPDC056672]|uniref:hypothetical protein n=1 Tax=Streptomyces sp. NPDC056672 TaxID=3345906 RepID=UPI00367C656E